MPGEGGTAARGDLDFTAAELAQATSVMHMTLVSNVDRSGTARRRLVWGEDAGLSPRGVGITVLLLPVLVPRGSLGVEKGNKGTVIQCHPVGL
jgi:hypothetical protein